MQVNERVLSFIAEWFDPHPALLKQYVLKYYVESSEVEMKDLSTNRKFLKRTKVDYSTPDFTIGGYILLFSRNLKLVNYADNYTRSLLESTKEETVVLIPPEKVQVAGALIEEVENSGFTVVNIATVELFEDDDFDIIKTKFKKEVEGNRKKMIGVSFSGKDSVNKVNNLLFSLSDKYGESIMRATTPEEVTRLTDFIYKDRPSTATYSNCTCCLIKPHIVKSRQVGAVIDDILYRGFDVSAMKFCNLDKATTVEFFEVYEGIWNEYVQIVDSLCSGSSIAMEIKADNEPVTSFRQSAGPWNVDMAKEMYPESIRAKFGVNNVENAIHCTDLKEDALSEVQYLFKVL